MPINIGNGSDGDLIVESGTVDLVTNLGFSLDTVLNFRNVWIKSGATLTIPNTNTGMVLYIRCMRSFRVDGSIILQNTATATTSVVVNGITFNRPSFGSIGMGGNGGIATHGGSFTANGGIGNSEGSGGGGGAVIRNADSNGCRGHGANGGSSSSWGTGYGANSSFFDSNTFQTNFATADGSVGAIPNMFVPGYYGGGGGSTQGNTVASMTGQYYSYGGNGNGGTGSSSGASTYVFAGGGGGGYAGTPGKKGVHLYIETRDYQKTGTIDLRGGNGGAGINGGNGTGVRGGIAYAAAGGGGGGGGAGGGGGNITIKYTNSYSNSGSLLFSGGTGGTGGTSGNLVWEGTNVTSTNGTNGTNGGTGGSGTLTTEKNPWLPKENGISSAMIF